MALTVRRLTPDRRADFHALHSEACNAGWCCCVAWWVPTWAGWGERTAEENRALRDHLFDRGEYDIVLLYEDERPVASCQVGPRDRLEKLTRQLALEPDPDCHAITCFLVAPDRRRRGRARVLLRGVLDDLRARGVKRVEAYPRRGADLPDGEAWTGPAALYAEEGFTVLREDATHPVLSLSLRAGGTRVGRPPEA